MKKSIVLAMLFMATGVCYVIETSAQESRSRQKSERENTARGKTNQSMINYKLEDKQYELVMENDQITELKVNGKLIEKQDYQLYENDVRKILAKVAEDKKHAEEDMQRSRIELAKADRQRELAQKDYEQAQLQQAKAEKLRAASEHDREVAMETRKKIGVEQKQVLEHQEEIRIDLERAKEEHKLAMEQMERSQADRQNADEHRKLAEKAALQATQAKVQAEKAQVLAEQHRRQAEEDKKLLDQLLNALVEANVVAGIDEIRAISLDGESLIVNDKKQSDELHKTFLKKYLKNGHNRLQFRNSDGTRQMSVDN